MKLLNSKRTFVGVDCHKDTIVCCIEGKTKEFKTTQIGFQKALEWCGKDCPWAIEGAYSYGLTLSVFLLQSGCKVYEFNALITAKARKALSIAGLKNDECDAKVISIFANQIPMQEASLKTIELKKKISARKLIIKQRTELTNNLKAVFMKTGEILPFKTLTTLRAVKWLINHSNIEISALAEIINTMNNSIQQLDKEIEKLMPEKAKRLIELTGIRTLTAAVIYTETKGKQMTKAQFASYCGVAPVECSSGLTQKYRNNKRGNRTLNSILYSISMNQSRFDKIGSEYFRKKLSEGKTKRHARKCLARQICNQIWKILFAH